MDTVEYSEHVVRVGKNIMRIAENVESAADNDIVGSDRDDAIRRARATLADYDTVAAALAADSKVLLGQFIKEFEYYVGLIRDSLARIDAKP